MNSSFFRTRRLIRVKDYIIYYLIILLITIFVIFPYYWMILTSIKPSDELMVSPTVWWPSHFDFSNYIIVWQQIPLLRYMGNTLFVAVVTTAVCLVISTATGYSLSRYKIRIREASITLILFTQLIPGMLPFVSFYFLMFRMHLTNTYSGLIIAYSIWGIPFCSLMMKSYFTSAVPISLEESATIDGCTKWGVLVRIALPISVPGLVATSIFSFILAWNEFMWASVMLTDPNKKTVAVGIYNFVGQYGNNVKISLTMTTAVLITVPAMIVFAFFQKYLVSGLTSGAIKG
jgi:multiple sugar transport system permease protein